MKKEKVIQDVNLFSSVKVKLFLTLCSIILMILIFLIAVNNFALENFYLYNKEKTLIAVYEKINNFYNNEYENINIESEIEKISIKNNFDILIKDGNGINIFSTSRNFSSTLEVIGDFLFKINKDEIRKEEKNFLIRRQIDEKNGFSYVMLTGALDNGYNLYVRVPITSIKDSVRISNNFLLMLAGITIFVASILLLIVSRKFTNPILELNNITKKMANLDFSQKYVSTNSKDEINNLGKNINKMSENLERVINQLRESNIELEKDIEQKSKIDEMRKSFISDVSHELKTPIALIQGYSEGLLENVNSDEESRKFYAEVILDETNKMDRLVKQLLELMKLEYGKREFNNTNFNIVECEKEVLRKSEVMLKEKNIKVQFEEIERVDVFADDFYIEQVITNYVTNAIKNVKEKNKEKIIKIYNSVNYEKNKVRITVYNSGDNIEEENLTRIWNRFYKVDKSRNRIEGGTGIGLAFVKAIMNNYKNEYGVNNVENGVEFYFELDLAKK